MAVTLVAARSTTSVTLGTAGDATEITLPANARTLRLTSAAPLRFAWSGTDGAALAAPYEVLAAEQTHTVGITDGGRITGGEKVYVASAVGGAVVTATADWAARDSAGQSDYSPDVVQTELRGNTAAATSYQVTDWFDVRPGDRWVDGLVTLHTAGSVATVTVAAEVAMPSADGSTQGRTGWLAAPTVAAGVATMDTWSGAFTAANAALGGNFTIPARGRWMRLSVKVDTTTGSPTVSLEILRRGR